VAGSSLAGSASGETSGAPAPLAPFAAPEPLPPPPPALAVRHPRGAALAYGLTAAGLAIGATFVNYLPAPALGDVRGYYLDAAALLPSIPLALVAPSDAFEVGGITAAAIPSQLVLRHAEAVDPVAYGPLSQAAGIFVLHQGYYAAYATYRHLRANGAAAGWDDGWRPYSAEQLITAPFHPKNLAHPIVLLPFAVELAIGGVSVGAYYGAGHKLPRQAAANLALAVPQAFDAGVTEEAMVRGVLYEELSLSVGRWPARMIDSALFAGLHVPQELNLPPERIATGLLIRAAMGLCLDLASDEGGLPESVTLHVLIDTVAGATNALTTTSLLGDTVTPSGGRGPSRVTTVIVPLFSGTL
jgi:membrane protease YdiL (CAAX protease family)